MHIHTDVLAAIGAAQIGHRPPIVIPSNRHDDSKEVTNGMCKYTREFLDSLASLSVAGGNRQVVAIALQMGNPPVLTIAENGPVKPALLPHLKEMLALLQCMAVEYARLDNWDGPPTEIPPRVQPYRNKLIRSVYLYSVDKILNRFKLFWVPLNDQLDIFDAWGNATELGEAGEWFKHVLYTLEYVQNVLRKIKARRNPVVGREWCHLIREMDRTMCDLASGNHSVAEIIPDARSASFCTQALNKLSSQHQHIHTLTKIAHAVRVDPNIRFDIDLCESTVFSPVSVNLPQTVEELQRIIGFILQDDNRPSNDLTEASDCIAASNIIRRFPREPYGKVHCECALITHLDNLPLDRFQIPPCNYIGLSKLSCAPCDVWIHAFNITRVPATTYHTMGTHGKWYRNWAKPPASSNWRLGIEMEIILRKRLAPGFTWSQYHCRSDSTIANGDTDRTSLAANLDDELSQDGIDYGCESETSLNVVFYAG